MREGEVDRHTTSINASSVALEEQHNNQNASRNASSASFRIRLLKWISVVFVVTFGFVRNASQLRQFADHFPLNLESSSSAAESSSPSERRSQSTYETTTITTETGSNDQSMNKIREENERDVTSDEEQVQSPSIKDMNIVLFYADDWTYRSMGKVNPYVKSPHIDEMANRGVFFTHNCVTTSICWQSRATLVTGLYVSKHGQMKISDEALFKQNDWTQSLYPLLREHGYHTGYVGKWHAPLPGNAAKQAFDYHNMYYGSHWMPRNGKLRHVTDLNNEDAIHYLRHVKPKDQKFALTVSFFATHSWDGQPFPLEYQPQEFTEHMYENKTIPTPKTATEEHWKRMPPFFDDNNEARRRWGNRYNTPDRFQETMKRYYRMAHEVDVVVGNVIREVKKQGLYDNTLFIFTTDNGMFHGEHGLAGKWYPHEESIRVPLVIQDPRMPATRRGTTNDEFTLNIDLAPTILSAAGIPVPKYMQGRDIAQLYVSPNPNKTLTPPWRKDFFYEWNQGSPIDASNHAFGSWIPAVFALVRKDYKYFYWPMFQYEQVFHVEKDPFEEVDLFPEFSNADDNSQSQKGILEGLKQRYAYLKNISQAGERV